MSSILRAMKKAEQTAAAGRFSGDRVDRGPAAGDEAPRRPRRLPRHTVAAAALLALAAALWGGIYLNRPAQTPGAPVGRDASPQAAPQAVAGGHRPAPPREAAPPPVSPVDGTGPALSPQSPATPAARLQMPVSEGRPAGLPGPAAAPVLGDQGAPPSTLEVAAEPAAVPAERPVLTLEGIVWSDDPKGRMAVINGKMLREGDLILGVRIQTIGENDVAVAAGGDRWTVRF